MPRYWKVAFAPRKWRRLSLLSKQTVLQQRHPRHTLLSKAVKSFSPVENLMARPGASPVPRELRSLLLQGCVACSCQDSTNSDKTYTRQRQQWPRQWQAEATAESRCKTTFFYLAALSYETFFRIFYPPVGQRPIGGLAACYCEFPSVCFFSFFSSFFFLFGLFVFLFLFFWTIALATCGDTCDKFYSEQLRTLLELYAMPRTTTRRCWKGPCLSQKAQGLDIMGRTEVTVFLLALAILPFLQNMLLNIGPGHYIHACTHSLSPKL